MADGPAALWAARRTRSLAAVRPGWSGRDRALLVLLLLAYLPGTPGLGVDTRPAADDAVIVGTAYGAAFLLALAALAASWRWPRLAGWSALGAGALAVVLPVLDLAGALGPPPPVAIVVFDVIEIVLGVLIAWRRSARASAAAPVDPIRS